MYTLIVCFMAWHLKKYLALHPFLAMLVVYGEGFNLAIYCCFSFFWKNVPSVVVFANNLHISRQQYIFTIPEQLAPS